MAIRKKTTKSAEPSATPARKPSRRRVRIVREGEAPEPVDGSLRALREAAAGCKRCPLWKPATQTVFGEGPARARVLLVGEQPGDAEDLSGHPFVGPAGKMLDRAMDELGLDRSRYYVTNAVKHFKFERRGKVRLHRSPDASERNACHVWLERELDTVRPDVVVCLGATAAKAVLGNKFGLMRERGQWRELPDGRRAFATVHPSYVLRQRGDDARHAAYADMLRDLSLLRGISTK